VGGLKSLPGDDIELRVRDNFGEFGELACVKAFPNRCAAALVFVLTIVTDWSPVWTELLHS
jgi:hypothetical protein